MAAECRSSKGTVSSNQVKKSKRRRFDDGDEGDNDGSLNIDSKLKECLAKELFDYLDRTIQDVEVCDTDDKKNTEDEIEEQVDDFQLFLNSMQKTLQTFPVEDQSKKEEPIASSSSEEEDEETTARLREAAVSAKDIFGSK